MKVVLGYSGGLDTSIIVPWLKENYQAEVICMAANVGQNDDLHQGISFAAQASDSSNRRSRVSRSNSPHNNAPLLIDVSLLV